MLIGRTLLSRYKIINKIGSGGFGDTYLAQDIALPDHPRCVVKQLKPKDPDPDVFPIAKGLFEREAKFLNCLGKHDQIPSLYAHFEEAGEFFLVEEFVDGDELSQEIVPGKPLSEKQTIELLQEILEVLTVVHQQNVIHRDIKPQNIMRRKRDGKIVLIDFGAVKEISALTVNSQGHTSLTVGVGSPGYMPSEQAGGRPKLASDVYAVGKIGIQALTGAKPNKLSEDPNTGEIIWRKVAPQVSDGLADVLDAMVRDHFSQRFAHASEALKRLETLMSTVVEPIDPSLPPTDSFSPEVLQSNFPTRRLKIGLAVAGIGAFVISGSPLFLEKFSSKPDHIITPQPPKPNPPTPQPPKPPKKIWRSQSALTRITNLDKICSGSSILEEVQTVFGYDNLPFKGIITIPKPKRYGCEVGDKLEGSFYLSGKEGKCIGNVIIEWKIDNNAYIKWNIGNLGSCPVAQPHWSINTYPEIN